MISFDNTEVAYENKSTRELRKARVLFSMFSTPRAVKINKLLLNLALFFRIPIDWIVKPTFYKLFIGGETSADCSFYIKKLSVQNVKSILQYSIEVNQDPSGYQAFYDEILQLIQRSANNPDIAFNVIKPSNLVSKEVLYAVGKGFELKPNEVSEFSRFRKWVQELCQESFNIQKPILFDAEESWCQPAVDDLMFQMMLKFNTIQCIVFSTFQMYRTDRLNYLFSLHRLAKELGFILGVKLVRGAYMEKERQRAEKMGYPSPIHETKADTDRDFNEALKYIVYNTETIAMLCGTHNEDSVNFLACLMDNSGLEVDDPHIYFSQLYGMSDNISFNLSLNGYNVAKCIPFGPPKLVLSYLIRRVEENTAVQGQSGRELQMIALELKRRKTSRNKINRV